MDGYEYRPVTPDEIPLILDSWGKGWRTSEYSGTTANHLFFANFRETLAGLIGRGAKLTAAAVGDRVVGYVCYEHKGDDTAVLHWVYCKDPWRRKGLGRYLTDLAIAGRPTVFYTHRTRHGKYVLPKHARWAPEIARRKDL